MLAYEEQAAADMLIMQCTDCPSGQPRLEMVTTGIMAYVIAVARNYPDMPVNEIIMSATRLAEGVRRRIGEPGMVDAMTAGHG